MNNLISVSLSNDYLYMNTTEIYLNLQNTAFFFLTGTFLLLGILYAFHFNRLRDIFFAMFSKVHSSKYLREENFFKKRVDLLLFLILILNLNLCIWTLNDEASLFNMILTFIGVLSYYLAKYLFILFLGYSFNASKLAGISASFTILVDKVFGVLLSLILFCSYFFLVDLTDYFIYFIYFLLTLMFLVKTFWIFKLGIKSFGLSRFYLFIYICMLEIFPVAILSKGYIFN